MRASIIGGVRERVLCSQGRPRKALAPFDAAEHFWSVPVCPPPTGHPTVPVSPLGQKQAAHQSWSQDNARTSFERCSAIGFLRRQIVGHHANGIFSVSELWAGHVAC